MSSLAPIVLFVYNRPWHTRKTVKALLKNNLAKDSELIIYSDAAKTFESEKDVTEVRRFIHTITGFKTVQIIERSKNWGLANSIIEGVSSVINKYGKIIVLEDDMVTSPYFLNFMNEALCFYSHEDKGFTISGYSKDIYFAHISTSWGWGTWKDRWNSVNWDNSLYLDMLADKNLIKDLESKVGNQRIKMLQLQVESKIDSWAVKRLFTQLIQKKMTVFPCGTLVNNIGHDGSGVHCKKNNRFDNNNFLDNKKLKITPFEENTVINRIIYNKNNTTFYSLIKIKLITMMEAL